MGINSVLKSKYEIEQAGLRLRKFKALIIEDPVKAWDMDKAFEYIRSQGTADDFVLDVGTSKCSLLELLYYNGYRNLFGCDLAPVEWRRLIYPYFYNKKPVDLLKALMGNPVIKLSRQDLQKTDYPSGHFDFITSISVIEHGVDIKAYLKEMSRLLRIGGCLITSADYRPEHIETEGIRPYGLSWKILCRKDIEEIIASAVKYGLELVEEIDFSYSEPVIHWNNKEYTAIFFVLRKVR